jgi:hypothetical protein
MTNLLSQIHDFDEFLSGELIDFQKANEVAKKRNLAATIQYTQTVYDTISMCQSIYRAMILPDKILPTQALTAKLVGWINKGVHPKLKEDITRRG